MSTTVKGMLHIRLREWRERKGLSQRDAAIACGLSPSVLCKLELGQTDAPRLDTLVKLAVGLRLPLSLLYKWSGYDEDYTDLTEHDLRLLTIFGDTTDHEIRVLTATLDALRSEP